MKATAAVVLALVLAGSGCVELPLYKHEAGAPPPPPPAPVKPDRPQPPVTGSQVNEANAHAKADALDDEIARDEEEELREGASQPKGPEKP
jgi:hypothetical protein